MIHMRTLLQITVTDPVGESIKKCILHLMRKALYVLILDICYKYRTRVVEELLISSMHQFPKQSVLVLQASPGNSALVCRIVIINFKKLLCSLTGLHQPYIQDFVDLRIVGSYMKYAFWRILDAGDIDWNEVFANLLPFHSTSSARWYMKYFRP